MATLSAAVDSPDGAPFIQRRMTSCTVRRRIAAVEKVCRPAVIRRLHEEPRVPTPTMFDMDGMPVPLLWSPDSTSRSPGPP